MATPHSTTTPMPLKFETPKSFKTLYAVGMFIGVLTFGVTLAKDQPRAWHAFLVAFVYFLNIGLGGIFFSAIHHVTGAGWSVNIRRFTESLTAFVPIAAVLALGFFFGSKYLYDWLNPEVLKADKIIAGKSSYLNGTFFTIRMVVFFGAWLLFSKLLVGNSIAQDQSGDEKLTLKNVPLSIGFLAVFALSYSFFSVDTLMSLDAHWFSTIFGIYCFAGLFQSTIAVLILMSIYMMKRGLVRGLVNENHLHDLAKYLKAFTVFYAYIAFSQFMLIWYANLPEETFFFLNRGQGTWLAITVSLLVFKFAVPFLLLLPRWAKRTPAHLILVSCLILVMQYVDLYWLVYPNMTNERAVFGFQEIGIFLGVLGAFVWAVTGFLEKNNLVPVKDPRIQESIQHHVTY